MIEYKKISLDHKPLLDSYLNKDFFYISDVSFGNLYIWQHARDIRYGIVQECLVIRTQYEGQKPFYFYPIGEKEENKISCIVELINDCKHKGEKLEFHSLEAKNTQALCKHFNGRFVLHPNRDRSDYVYSISELIELNGRKYHKKKNHLNGFLQTYPEFIYTSIDAQNKYDVLCVWEEWFAKTAKQASQGLKDENIGIRNVLEDYEFLGLRGGFISVNNRIIAFSFGEVINSEMVVVHIEKADSDYRGAYQIINQQLLLNEFSSYVYANREEDLGIEGLRKAKMSYNPIFLVEKFEAIFQE
ncbi:phosphatidylglycerol lysyltransferase domain-containing protein [Helicobacter sp. 11S03491-1]|uniref:DUF2156 domain-containing protein n=1 Tax=Helicobacter sp. 11S03491-1 TaxID=1476196 RepID=UPI000BA68D28|nr:phosphatidylglycerol lysyltransferase domain-containing protein [Helicobacter sp. 11S03491-1]PAF41491.1 hypothetical protein BKH45_07160 [Helicobacter sp. 11S03491-1]